MGNAIISRVTDISKKADLNHKHDAQDITSGTLNIERGGTGAETAEQVRRNLNVPYRSMFSYGNYDINNIVDAGFYTVSYSGTTNAPPTKNFTPSWLLMVISSKTTSLDVGTFQICSEIFNVKSPSMWIRKCDGISDWTDWEDINYNSDTNLLRCISEDIDLWVSPSGNDTTGDGSMNNPYATVTKALSIVSGKYISSNVSVYVYQGTYIDYDLFQEIKAFGHVLDEITKNNKDEIAKLELLL